MAVYNSFATSNQEDSDITIIHPSIIDEHNDEYVPIITRLKQANHSSENRQETGTHINNQNNNNTNKCEISDGKHDFIFVDHNPHEHAKQLEQILMFYIRDLKQETKTQLDCDQQLVTRLMDLIRPAYPTNQQKMIELDKIMADIASLHDKRHVENKEKVEQFRTEICQLNKMLCATTHEQSMCIESNRNSMTNGICQDPMNDYNQWTEIEDDAKKLHEIVQSQKNQINEIVTLISQTATASASLDAAEVSTVNSETAVVDKQMPPSPSPHTTIISTLLRKIQNIAGQQSSTTVATSQETTLQNHSPGISPTQSLATLTLSSLQTPVNDQTSQNQEPPTPKDQQSVYDEPIDIPLATVVKEDPKICPICNQEFDSTLTDMELYAHIENCLSKPYLRAEPTDYECPNCTRKLPGIDESVYLQHLSDCYNRDI